MCVSVQIQNLEGLERFLALGTLSLSGNNLTWSELTKIQHMHILNLNLHSNPLLQKDPYCELHQNHGSLEKDMS